MIVLVLLFHVRKKQPIRRLLHLLDHEIQDLLAEIRQRMQYDGELRAAELVRLERV